MKRIIPFYRAINEIIDGSINSDINVIRFCNKIGQILPDNQTGKFHSSQPMHINWLNKERKRYPVTTQFILVEIIGELEYHPEFYPIEELA